jgi:hypothetical protein
MRRKEWFLKRKIDIPMTKIKIMIPKEFILPYLVFVKE